MNIWKKILLVVVLVILLFVYIKFIIEPVGEELRADKCNLRYEVPRETWREKGDCEMTCFEVCHNKNFVPLRDGWDYYYISSTDKCSCTCNGCNY